MNHEDEIDECPVNEIIITQAIINCLSFRKYDSAMDILRSCLGTIGIYHKIAPQDMLDELLNFHDLYEENYKEIIEQIEKKGA